ncbi:MAG: class B sortase [Candidatus Gastranaerophilales bacterium]|nr:class B sortase [Candidatus Gastranaerophilales bacterium]
MTQKTYVVEGRQFRTQSDYARASRDKELIDKLRQTVQNDDPAALRQLSKELHNGKYKFFTLLGQDFKDEIDDRLKTAGKGGAGKGSSRKKSAVSKADKKTSSKSPPAGKEAASRQGIASRQGAVSREGAASRQGPTSAGQDAAKEQAGETPQMSGEMAAYVEEELKQREKRRKLLICVCSLVGVVCLGYFTLYSYYQYRTRSTYERWSDLRENSGPMSVEASTYTPVIHYTDTGEMVIPEVLDEYKIFLSKNQRLIGWLIIDDTKINYPVMQTVDNEYYLTHNLDQEYDKNGSIFMDKDCDVLKPSTNFILYGHHMQSGQMFGQLDKYADQKFADEHPYIQFDTIYEHGTYQVMYVFRSRVYSEDEIVFKYYQFIDAASEQEFDSYMQEMAEMSLIETDVTAQYGDQLLTLSTCDYQEENGRFVVVAKKVAAKE